MFSRSKSTVDTPRSAADIARDEYQNACYQVKRLLWEMRLDEQSAILDYMIKVVKRDLVSEGLAKLIYRSETPGWRDAIPIPEQFREEKHITLDMKRTSVLTIPWSCYRLSKAICDLVRTPFDKSKTQATYYPEIDLVIVENGMHHSAAASIDGGGEIDITHIFHLTPAFDELTTDGGVWIDGKGRTDVKDFRFALLYTLAKMRHDL